MVFSPRYCCCAIPLVNVGMYALLSEQFVVTCVAGVLAIATPTIVGSYVPSYTPYILAALCFIVAAIQLVGFYGIYKEQIRTFRTYAAANAFAFGCIFACGAALVGVSAAKHNDAVSQCISAYFTSTATDAPVSVSSEGKTICQAFAWADVGIMGGLWLILLVGQSYFIFMTKVYASEQKDDHQNYKSIYEANAEEFAMMERNSQWGPNADAWDHRPSMDSIHDTTGGNMYEQPYSQPYRPGARDHQYSESSLKNEYDKPPPGEPDYEYRQAQDQQYAEEQYQQHEQHQQQHQQHQQQPQPYYSNEQEYDQGYGHGQQEQYPVQHGGRHSAYAQ